MATSPLLGLFPPADTCRLEAVTLCPILPELVDCILPTHWRAGEGQETLPSIQALPSTWYRQLCLSCTRPLEGASIYGELRESPHSSLLLKAFRVLSDGAAGSTRPESISSPLHGKEAQ